MPKKEGPPLQKVIADNVRALMLAGASMMLASYNRVYDACMRSKGYPRKP